MDIKEKGCLDRKGDANTKFFHSFASSRHKGNMIWDIMDEDGVTHMGQNQLMIEQLRTFQTTLNRMTTQGLGITFRGCGTILPF